MKNLIGAISVLLCLSQIAAADTIKIVATTTDLADITQAIVGDTAEIMCMTTGREDPHTLTARPSFIIRARDAHVWIRNGMELEIGWEPVVLRGARNTRIHEHTPGHIDASTHVRKLEVPTRRVTRDQGDVHPAGNPHYLLDPFNGRLVAAMLNERLVALYPQHKEIFEKNLHAFERELDIKMFGKELVDAVSGRALWIALLENRFDAMLTERSLTDKVAGWYATMRPHSGKVITTYHRSLTYFADRFGLRPDIQLEPKPGIPPTAKHLVTVVEEMKTHNVSVIAQAPYYQTKAAKLVAERTGASWIALPYQTGGSKEATGYLAMIDNLVQKLSGAL